MDDRSSALHDQVQTKFRLLEDGLRGATLLPFTHAYVRPPPHDYDVFEDRSPVRGCNREVKRDLGGPERSLCLHPAVYAQYGKGTRLGEA